MPRANSNEYKRAFRDEHYDQLAIAIPKGEKTVWKEAAKAYGKSLNAFIIEAVKEKMEREKDPPP